VPTILLIEEEKILRTMIEDILSREGYQLICVVSGEEAMKKIEARAAEVIILDVVLAGTSCLYLLSHIMRQSPEVPVIVLAGTEGISSAIAALKLGAFDYVRKPVNMEELIHAVKLSLRVYDLGKERRRWSTQLNRLEKSSMQLSDVAKAGMLGRFQLTNEQILTQTIDLISQVLDAQIISLMLIDRKTQEMKLSAAKGLSQEIIDKSRKKVGEGIAGWVAKEGKPLLIKDVSQDPIFRESRFYTQYTTKSLMCVPLMIRDQMVGVLNANNKLSGESFTDADLSLFITFSCIVSLVLENMELQEKLVGSIEEITKLSKRLVRANIDLEKKSKELEQYRVKGQD
jgi:DNA-binding response OmpR family regulator